MANFVQLVLIGAVTMIIGIQSGFLDISLDEFSDMLYYALSENSSHGYLVSPLSLYIAISLIALGAAGDTANETWAVMEIDIDDRQQFTDALLGLLKSFDVDGPTLQYSSKIFINETQVLENFTKLATTNYECDMQAVDYNDFATTYRLMSEWIMEHCENGSINTALSSIYFPDDLFLTSVLAFNAEWETPFDVENTTIGSFFTPDGKETFVEMMYFEGYLLYINVYGDQFLMLNYKDSNWAILLWLPPVQSGEQLTYKKFRKIASILKDETALSYVQLMLPKCNVTFIRDFSNFLPQMGFSELLEPDADFSAMLKDQSYFSDADSQYLVKFMMNEWGTGTDLNQENDIKLHGTPEYHGDDIVEYNVNRTFGIHIFNKATYYDLMIGRITNPTNV